MERGLMGPKLGNFAYLEDFDKSYFSSDFDMFYAVLFTCITEEKQGGNSYIRN